MAWQIARAALAIPILIGLATALSIHVPAMLFPTRTVMPSLDFSKWMHLAGVGSFMAALAAHEVRRRRAGLQRLRWFTRRSAFGIPWWSWILYCAVFAYMAVVMLYAFHDADPATCHRQLRRVAAAWKSVFTWCQGTASSDATGARVFSAAWLGLFGGALVVLVTPLTPRVPEGGPGTL